MSGEPSIPFDRLRTIAASIAAAAADLVRASDQHRTVATKSTATDIVTATDLAAEARIRELIAVAAPGSLVLGEEGGHALAGDGDHADIEWIVDPIDGTVNFAYGLPVTAVSVAAAIGGRHQRHNPQIDRRRHEFICSDVAVGSIAGLSINVDGDLCQQRSCTVEQHLLHVQVSG